MASIRRRHSRLSSGWRRPLVAGTVSRRRFSGVASDRPGGSGHARDGMPSADQGPTRDGRSPAGGRHEAMAIIKASGPLVIGRLIDAPVAPPPQEIALLKATFEQFASGVHSQIKAVYPFADQRATALL